MVYHIEGTNYGFSYIGMFADFYIGKHVWRHISRLQSMETHIEGKMYGYSYRGCNAWRLI